MNVKSIAVLAGFALVGSLIGVAVCGWRASQAASATTASGAATGS